MNRKSGFTLAEVLVTLMIIGVIAAMTIPSLMQTTAKQEYVAALKKAISTLNQGLALNYALEGVGANEEPTLGFLSRRMNITNTESSIQGGFYTSDGIYYQLDGTKIEIDVNGTKNPNKFTEGENAVYDKFTLVLDTGRNIVRAGEQAEAALYSFQDAGATSSSSGSGS